MLLVTSSRRPLPSCIVLQQKSIFYHQIFTNDFFHECEQICTPSNHFVIYFKCLLQICTKINGFKFYFSKIFCGGAPSPAVCQIISPFFSLALSSVTLNFLVLRGFDSTLDWRTNWVMWPYLWRGPRYATDWYYIQHQNLMLSIKPVVTMWDEINNLRFMNLFTLMQFKYLHNLIIHNITLRQ